MRHNIPFSTLEILQKYPQLQRLMDIDLYVPGRGEDIQKRLVDITELVRQLDFKAYGGIEL